MIEDPLCLLTASRDRSVKIRALPKSESSKTNDFDDTTYGAFPVDPQENEISAATVTVEASVIGRETSNEGESSNERLPPTIFWTKEINLGHTKATEQTELTKSVEQIMVGELVKPTNPTELQNSLHVTAREATASLLLHFSGSTLLESSPVLSSSDKLPPPYGYDLAVLTLGRIEDGFRRDAFVFPVDLKGRGQGRAAEARAVLQVCRRPVSPPTVSSTLPSFPRLQEETHRGGTIEAYRAGHSLACSLEIE